MPISVQFHDKPDHNAHLWAGAKRAAEPPVWEPPAGKEPAREELKRGLYKGLYKHLYMHYETYAPKLKPPITRREREPT